MAKSDDKRDHQLTVRIPQHIRDALEREAEVERRSVADVVNIVLQDHFAKRRKGGK